MIVSPIITGDYTIFPNPLLNSSHISPIAKIIWLTIKSKGPKWNVYNEYLAKELSISVTTLKKYIAQLISSGWMSRTQRRAKSGKLLGGYDYILHSSPSQSNSPKNLSTDFVDNNEGFDSFDHSISPIRQHLAPNKELKTNNIKNNKPVVALSSSVDPVDNNSIDQVELAAANQYVDNQKGVRDRAAYLACTIRNGWHKQLYQALQDKMAKIETHRKISIIRNKFRLLDNKARLNLQNEIYSKLYDLSCDKSIYNNEIQELIACWRGDNDSIRMRSIISEINWYYFLNSHYPNALTKPEAPTSEHYTAFQLASQILAQYDCQQ